MDGVAQCHSSEFSEEVKTVLSGYMEKVLGFRN